MTSLDSQFRYFAAVSPGLEQLLAAELSRLRVAGKVTPGGVECHGNLESLWQLTRFSRLAESVRLRLKPFEARTFAELERGLEKLPWHAYLSSGHVFDVTVVCHASALYHTQAVAERLQRVVVARCGAHEASKSQPTDTVATSAARPAQQKIQVRISHNVVQTSIDACGERLHRRGYRTHVGPAPLRETLAAAAAQMLEMLTSPRSHGSIGRVWDPCCGSATLLSEWLLGRLGVPTNPTRTFAFERWPIHDAMAYASWVALHQPPPPTDAPLQAWGSDRDSKSIAAARHNVALAGLTAYCQLIARDFRVVAQDVPADTAVVTNLPYGVRLEHRRAAAALFESVDGLLDQRRDLRPVVALNTLDPPKRARCHWQRMAVFANGGLRVNAWGIARRTD